MTAILSFVWSLLQPLLGDLIKSFAFTTQKTVTEKTDAQLVPSTALPVDAFDDLLARRAVPVRGVQLV